MKVDAIMSGRMAHAPAEIRRLQSIGYDGAKVAELDHDPFLPLAIAAEHSDQIELMTSVAVAFARNPMSLAILAHDLNAYSSGRFILGLGTQVRPHVERRFGMPWHKGPRQMREFINAMGAIFDCWYDGQPLNFEGEYYNHTLMPKTFTPGDIEFGRPKVLLSATGPLMTKVAAETADGLIMHPFSTERYIREVNLPAIEEGLGNAGRTREDFQIDYAPLVATGSSEKEIAKAVEVVRGRIAFYGSTPGYRGVLELHGWGDLQSELNALMKQHRSEEMSKLVDDEILHTFAIVAEPDAAVEEISSRFGKMVDRTAFYAPSLGDEQIAELLQKLRA